MTHDPLCICGIDPCQEQEPCYPEDCPCACTTLRQARPIIEAQARADERSRKGTCWRETAEGVEIPPGAIRVYREAGWFWEMP
jgi:hypothetical protein